MKRFAESQFGYCLLTWMFASRKVNSKIKHLKEQSLSIIYDDYITSFEELIKRQLT